MWCRSFRKTASVRSRCGEAYTGSFRYPLYWQTYEMSPLMLRNLAFLKGYADSVEEKQIALQRQQTRDYQAKQIEALARGREQRIKLLAAARAQAIVVKADARKQARIIRKKADAEALRLVKGALRTYPHMLTYRYIEQLSPERAVMIIKNGKSSVVLR